MCGNNLEEMEMVEETAMLVWNIWNVRNNSIGPQDIIVEGALAFLQQHQHSLPLEEQRTAPTLTQWQLPAAGPGVYKIKC